MKQEVTKELQSLIIPGKKIKNYIFIIAMRQSMQ